MIIHSKILTIENETILKTEKLLKYELSLSSKIKKINPIVKYAIIPIVMLNGFNCFCIVSRHAIKSCF